MADPGTDYAKLNDTELWTLVRKQYRIDRRVPREGLIEILEGKAGPITAGKLQLTLIDGYKLAILDWARENWDKIYYQISCPLGEEGCMSCSDFRAVSCLVHNSHVFDVGKEPTMSNFNVALRMIVDERMEDATGVLKNLIAAGAAKDDKATRAMIAKVLTAACDYANGGPIKTLSSYVGMYPREYPEEVVETMKGKKSPEVVEAIIAKINAAPKSQTEEAPAAAAEEKQESKPAPEPKPAEPAPKKPKTTVTQPSKLAPAEDAYFPGVEVVSDAAPLKPGQDASQFAKPEKAAPSPSTVAKEAVDGAVKASAAATTKAAEPAVAAPKGNGEGNRPKESPITTQALGQACHLIAHGLEEISTALRLIAFQAGCEAPVDAHAAPKTAESQEIGYTGEEDSDTAPWDEG